MRAQRLTAIGFFLSIVTAASAASAADATVTIGDDRFAQPPRYAEPPRPARPVYIAAPQPTYDPPPSYGYETPELYRSPFRLHVGPAAVTTGLSLGGGLGVAADFGTGSVGLRLAAVWLRGEPSTSDPARGPSPIGDGLAQYTGELTLDFYKRGPVHPIFGLGFGMARVSRGDSGGTLGIGTARLGFEYAFALDDADVRLGAGITGVLPGPADRDVSDVRGYAILGASLGVGF